MNSLDPNQAGGGYEYINMNRFKNNKKSYKEIEIFIRR